MAYCKDGIEKFRIFDTFEGTVLAQIDMAYGQHNDVQQASILNNLFEVVRVDVIEPHRLVMQALCYDHQTDHEVWRN